MSSSSPTSSRLHGRPIIVTGAVGGIGTAIAHRLAADGARVGVVDVHPDAMALAASIDGVAATVDLTDASATADALHALIDELGGCWGLVNNAGIFAKTPILELDLAEWDAIHDLNVRACVTTIQAVAPTMIAAGGGRIVNQASMAAKRGTAGEAAYAASKAALVALTRVAAIEFGPHQITANAVCPGYVLTEMGAATRDARQVERWTASSPLGRLAEPADVAATVAHLVSDDAAYVTGQALNVTGGMCTW